MRLYATVTSERASKGQGGNESLDIEITHEEEGLVWKIEGRIVGDEITYTLYNVLYGGTYETKLKGEKQKGEHDCICDEDHGSDDDHNCDCTCHK